MDLNELGDIIDLLYDDYDITGDIEQTLSNIMTDKFCMDREISLANQILIHEDFKALIWLDEMMRNDGSQN